MSHDQHKHNSEYELLVSLFLHGLVIGAASGTVLTVSPSANLRGARRSRGRDSAYERGGDAFRLP